MSDPTPEDLSLPDRIGPYPVRSLLGKGGQGQVFLVVDPVTGAELALKLQHQTIQSAARLRQEYLLLSLLDHPGLPRGHRLGGSREAIWLTMERVEGVWLSRHVAWGGPPGSIGRQQRLMTALLSICAPLQALHTRGILHSDLKPDNILVAPGGHTWLLDLGGAWIRGAPQRRVLATWSFSAPEVLFGGAPVMQSDLYALGVAAYRVLTDHHPQPGKTREEVLAALHQPCPTARDRFPDVDADLSALLSELMAREPDTRPPDVAAVQRRLLAMGARPPVRLPPPLPGEEAVHRRARALLDERTPGVLLSVCGQDDLGRRGVLARIADDARRLGLRVVEARDPALPAAVYAGEPTLVVAHDLERAPATTLRQTLHLREEAEQHDLPVVFLMTSQRPMGTASISLDALSLAQTRERLRRQAAAPTGQVSAAVVWQVHQTSGGLLSAVDRYAQAPVVLLEAPAPEGDVREQVAPLLASDHPEQAAPLIAAALRAEPAGAHAAWLWLALAEARQDEPTIRDAALRTALATAPPEILPTLRAQIVTASLGGGLGLEHLKRTLHAHLESPLARAWNALNQGDGAEAERLLPLAASAPLRLLLAARLALRAGQPLSPALPEALPGLSWTHQVEARLLLSQGWLREGRFSEALDILGPAPEQAGRLAAWRLAQAEVGLWLYRLGEVRAVLADPVLHDADTLPLETRAVAATVRARLALLTRQPRAAAADLQPVLRRLVDAGRDDLAAEIRGELGRAAGAAGLEAQAEALTTAAIAASEGPAARARARCSRAVALAPWRDPVPELADLRPWLLRPQARLLWLEVCQADLDFSLFSGQLERARAAMQTLEAVRQDIADRLCEDDARCWWLHQEATGGRL